MSEITKHARFDRIRYAQVWEDAEILCKAIHTAPDARYLSVASAGDNALALLTLNPRKVVALDLNPAQIHCLELRVAAMKTLHHMEFLQLMGSRPSPDRNVLFDNLKPLLNETSRRFWETQPAAFHEGFAGIGKFENYFSLFRKWILPLIHSTKRIDQLLSPKSGDQRIRFYEDSWSNWRWRALFHIFFSKTVMGMFGRDPAFFRYVKGGISRRILERAQYAATHLSPAENPYLHWILKGFHGDVLPLAWRRDQYDRIRENIDRLEWHTSSIESYLLASKEPFDGFNLSDIFEYMSEKKYLELLGNLVDHSVSGARLVYWNMMAPRYSPESFHHRVTPLYDLASELHDQDKAFFYDRFVVEQVL
ncbi:MAG: DUF3419 family protein [Okeania sp. SIO3C4]|nr:DUF3419 family protein [Okeania sp. SIO3C4]